MPFRRFRRFLLRAALLSSALSLLSFLLAQSPVFAQHKYQLNDSHFHLTNYIQEGIDIHKLLSLMGDRVGRVALFGIPLQQQWSYRVDGNHAPAYYLSSDAPLYYYSFTDAYIAMAYKSLTKEEQARFDPMITGFNPTDMYAADHIRRVLQTFPGVFSGIGEFSIHKEFVSSKIAGNVASLQDPALDRILDFAADAGLVVIIHNDIDTPFSKYQSDVPSDTPGPEPLYLSQMKALIQRHPKTTIIWAHTGLGRIIRPVKAHAAVLDSLLSDPAFNNLYFDISWTEVAKYIVSSPEATQVAADLINRHPDRFLFGTDEVAPPDQKTYLRIYDIYAPLFALLSPDASEKLRLANYDRLFDEARRRVRLWERDHPPVSSTRP
ncbi:MAG TPA: amidohydrolase family protein [Candidatus Acidoferrales bacterium]|nr:amidohydrolase family protein [Candidatus Acidoferrales bacterium]